MFLTSTSNESIAGNNFLSIAPALAVLNQLSFLLKNLNLNLIFLRCSFFESQIMIHNNLNTGIVIVWYLDASGIRAFRWLLYM